MHNATPSVLEGTHHPSSFRDNRAFLFRRDGQLYRAVHKTYKSDYELLHSSGLYQELTARNWLVPHHEISMLAPADISLILKPELLPCITYPYEWSFSQLKQAALLTLKIADLALKHNMLLKDASGFNVGWKDGEPIFIDLPSFRALVPGEPWPAYRQFCSHFLAPLSLMAYVDLNLQKLLLSNIDGLPLDLASRLMPRRTWLNLNLLIHIHLHARAQKKYSGTEKKVEVSVSATTLRNLFHSLRLTVEKMRLPTVMTEWGDYYSATNYTPEQFEQKKAAIAAWIEEVKPATVFDIGANDGTFSRLAGRRAALVVSADIDPVAIEKNFNFLAANKIKNIVPLLQDLAQPSPGLGWNLEERTPLRDRIQPDMGLALALVHHIVIGNNVPLKMFCRYLHQTAPAWIVEFPAKDDSQVQRLLRNREDIFPDYTVQGFERAMEEFFTIKETRPIEGSHRTLYLAMRRQRASQ